MMEKEKIKCPKCGASFRAAVQKKAGLSAATMKYLDEYEYSLALFEKLAN